MSSLLALRFKYAVLFYPICANTPQQLFNLLDTTNSQLHQLLKKIPNANQTQATILSLLQIDNPAAKVLVDLSKTQDAYMGDGTTSVVVLAGELLREAEKLVQLRIHPMTLVEGWRMAADCAKKALMVSARDNSGDPVKFRAGTLCVFVCWDCIGVILCGLNIVKR